MLLLEKRGKLISQQILLLEVILFEPGEPLLRFFELIGRQAGRQADPSRLLYSSRATTPNRRESECLTG